MRDLTRLIATGFIWTMLAIMVTMGGGPTGDTVPLAFILGIGATISTMAIWQSSKTPGKIETEQAAKHKRSSRVSRLMDDLDEDEVYQLEELLAARQDEQLRERR